MQKIFKIITILFAFCISSCESEGINLDSSKKWEHKMDFKKFFDGEIATKGIIQNWYGKVISTFTVDIECLWEGNNGKMIEKFQFNDGSTLDRTWYLKKTDDGKYIGTADDVIGEAEGIENEIGINFLYKIKIPKGDSFITLNADDKMFMVDENAIINKTTMYKLGFPVLKLTMFLEKK